MWACVSPACANSSGSRGGPLGVLPAAEGVWVFQHSPAVHRAAGWGGCGSRARPGRVRGLRRRPNRPCASRNRDKWGDGRRRLPAACRCRVFICGFDVFVFSPGTGWGTWWGWDREQETGHFSWRGGRGRPQERNGLPFKLRARTPPGKGSLGSRAPFRASRSW